MPATKRWSDSENAEWKEEKQALCGRIYTKIQEYLFLKTGKGNTGGGLSGIWIINNHGSSYAYYLCIYIYEYIPFIAICVNGDGVMTFKYSSKSSY